MEPLTVGKSTFGAVDTGTRFDYDFGPPNPRECEDPVRLPEGDPPPCPKCASIAVTATQYPEDQVVWFLCHRCKHTWCELLDADAPKRPE